MKNTLSITQKCNLDCAYCYIKKHEAVMPIDIAEMIINEIFAHAPENEQIDIGFFGGEPLLHFPLIKQIVGMIECHPKFDQSRIDLDVVTNGTIFNDEIADYLTHHNITFCLSCDGPSKIQDMFRTYPSGAASSATVENTIIHALRMLPTVLVNAVYHPSTFESLPDVINYFSYLGLKQIYLSPDFSAQWPMKDARKLYGIYNEIAEQYIAFYLKDDPHYINLIDSKILVMLKGGYTAADRCAMGRKEFAYAPSGHIYPCERLIGADDNNQHCIGHISSGLGHVSPCNNRLKGIMNHECINCSIRAYCMNWCGCSNFFSSGNYDRSGPFLCASEKASITAANHALRSLETQLGPAYIDRMMGFISRTRFVSNLPGSGSHEKKTATVCTNGN